MAFTMKQTIFVLSLAVLASFANAQCSVHPKFWCLDADVAKQCGVFEQCQPWLNRVNPASPKVTVDVYYESLCPGCRQFVHSFLNPTYAKLKSIMDVTLVPFGNGAEKKVGDKWEFTCQHHAPECYGNLVETCTINLVKDVDQYLPFIACIADPKNPADFETVAKTCGKSFPTIPVDKILECSKSAQGNEWEHEMALKTLNLKPPHQYTPWIIVDGFQSLNQTQAMFTDMVKVICDAYKGTDKPQACKEY